MSKKRLFIASAAILLVSAAIFVRFLSFHEARVNEIGWVFNDPIFHFLPRFDCSISIFSLTYGSLILYFILERKKSFFLTKLNLSYALLLIVRIITISLVPLKEPEGLIYLQDPFLNDLVYPGRIVTDLFFSGHTALLFLLYCISKRSIFVILTVVMGVLLMVQRVHYSIDVIAAIPFGFAIVKVIELGIKRLKVPE